jgi:arylsulfatase A-like enzyme
VYYLADHGLTLGEHGIIGKSTPRPYREIHHVPYLIHDPTGRMAGRTSRFFASTHDVAPTILSFMGIRRPGLMNGEDLTVLFDGRAPPERRYYTSCYQETWIAGDHDWVMIANTEGSRRELYDLRVDPGNENDVAAVNQQITDRLWQALVEEGGGCP